MTLRMPDQIYFDTERSRRYIRFDVDALCKIAAKACDAEECISVKKIAEGV